MAAPLEVGGGQPRADPVQPSARSPRRRRPSGEPPPLPRHLQASGLAWFGLTVGLIVFCIVWGLWPWARGVTNRSEFAVLEAFTSLRSSGLTSVARVVDALGSEWSIRILRWSAIIALVVLRRWRHLFVLVGAWLGVEALTNAMVFTLQRPRPVGIEILTGWEGFSSPSRPTATLAATLIGMTYALLPSGPARQRAKWGIAAVLTLYGLGRLYLGVEHPIDVLFGLIAGIAVPLVTFRMLAPNEVYPVTYGRGRAAHLALDERRRAAIEKALSEQLGISPLKLELFGLAGSAGSTPLRIQISRDPDTYLFGKLYAATHLRSDRWYKLGRTLLYGRLEDEGKFETVRRLVQYEDYMLRVMHAAGLPVAEPYGFVEITPEREYLSVTSFFHDAREIGDERVVVDEALIDDALEMMRTMWHAGVAHRDIKAANLLVKDGRVKLIDVAFGQVRPSPWRQAVDLANMMIVLALRSDVDLVYQRALQFFTPDEIAEAFAASRGVTLPSQSRQMLKEDKRQILKRFRELAPPREPIAIQRWSMRRVGLTVGTLLLAAMAVSTIVSNLGTLNLWFR